MSSPEQQTGPESTVETPKVSPEQYERAHEQSVERAEQLTESAEKQAEKARIEALENAISVEKGGAEKDRKPADSAPRRRKGTIPKREKKASFDKHMQQVRAEMTAPERAFSKFIHAPIVEKASETVGATIARPNAVLAGSVTAFILVLGVYIVAKTFGYVLSGFETIGAFIIGWVIGILYDYFRIMITGKKS